MAFQAQAFLHVMERKADSTDGEKGDPDPDQGHHSHNQLYHLQGKCLEDNGQQLICVLFSTLSDATVDILFDSR